MWMTLWRDTILCLTESTRTKNFKNNLEKLLDILLAVCYNIYTIRFEFEGDEAKADLPKSCAPGCHNEVADATIITAMSTIYCNRGDYVQAKQWLDKLINK